MDEQNNNEILKYLVKANNYCNVGEYDKALEECNKIFTINPTYENAIKVIIEIFVAKNDYQGFINEFDNIAQKWISTKIIDKGINTISTLLKSNFTSVFFNDNKIIQSVLSTQLGNLYYHNENYNEAIEYFTQTIELLSDTNKYNDTEKIIITNILARAYKNRGFSYYYSWEYEKSLSDYQKAISMNPSEPDLLSKIYINLGELNLEEKKYDEAIEAYQNAVSYTDNSDIKSRANVGRINANAEKRITQRNEDELENIGEIYRQEEDKHGFYHVLTYKEILEQCNKDSNKEQNQNTTNICLSWLSLIPIQAKLCVFISFLFMFSFSFPILNYISSYFKNYCDDTSNIINFFMSDYIWLNYFLATLISIVLLITVLALIKLIITIIQHIYSWALLIVLSAIVIFIFSEYYKLYYQIDNDIVSILKQVDVGVNDNRLPNGYCDKKCECCNEKQKSCKCECSNNDNDCIDNKQVECDKTSYKTTQYKSISINVTNDNTTILIDNISIGKLTSEHKSTINNDTETIVNTIIENDNSSEINEIIILCFIRIGLSIPLWIVVWLIYRNLQTRIRISKAFLHKKTAVYMYRVLDKPNADQETKKRLDEILIDVVKTDPMNEIYKSVNNDRPDKMLAERVKEMSEMMKSVKDIVVSMKDIAKSNDKDDKNNKDDSKDKDDKKE